MHQTFLEIKFINFRGFAKTFPQIDPSERKETYGTKAKQVGRRKSKR